jgi:hypothetical protein
LATRSIKLQVTLWLSLGQACSVFVAITANADLLDGLMARLATAEAK